MLPPLHNTLVVTLPRDNAHDGVINNCIGVHEEVLKPKLSHIDFTCQKYTLATCKELRDILEVLTVSYDHEPP